MAEMALKSLQSYTIQLEQVEAALSSDPDNEELKQLRSDLQEVIALTKNLPETLGIFDSGVPDGDGTSRSKQWKVGDRCIAQWSDDGKWYEAMIDAITEDGLVAVTFEEYGNSSVTKISSLKPCKGKDKSLAGGGQSGSDKSRKRLTEQQRLVAKKKKQKKFDRQKVIEEAHEADKAKWQAFTNKFNKVNKSKKLKGITKKSIFATPETANGRVGIGTCGIGGKPMTSFTHAEKWRKGT